MFQREVNLDLIKLLIICGVWTIITGRGHLIWKNKPGKSYFFLRELGQRGQISEIKQESLRNTKKLNPVEKCAGEYSEADWAHYPLWGHICDKRKRHEDIKWSGKMYSQSSWLEGRVWSGIGKMQVDNLWRDLMAHTVVFLI